MEQTDGRTERHGSDRRTDGFGPETDRWTDGQTDLDQTDEQTEQTDGQTEQTDGQKEAGPDRRTDGSWTRQTDRQTWTRQTDRRKLDQTDGQTEAGPDGPTWAKAGIDCRPK